MGSSERTGSRKARGGGRLELVAHDPAAVLDRLFEGDPGDRLRTMPGRETFRVRRAEGDWIVKRTTGQDARDWWFERLRPGGPRSPGRREADNLRALGALGLRVPRPLLWAEEPAARRRGGGRSVVVMEYVDHVADLRSLLEREPERAARLAEPLGAAVADLHRAGWYHRDLYLHQWLVGADGGLTLIDLGRARHERAPRLRWFVKDLAALALWLPAGVAAADRARFLATWERLGGVGPFSRRGRRRLVRAVLAKRDRLGAHEPKTPDAVALP